MDAHSVQFLDIQSYIDFEIGEGERERTRELYERLLQRTHHVKVWMSYADFEGAPMPEPDEEEEEDAQAAAARTHAAQSGPESAASRQAKARRWAIAAPTLSGIIPHNHNQLMHIAKDQIPEGAPTPLRMMRRTHRQRLPAPRLPRAPQNQPQARKQRPAGAQPVARSLASSHPDWHLHHLHRLFICMSLKMPDGLRGPGDWPVLDRCMPIQRTAGCLQR